MAKPIDIKALQTRLRVTADGQFGPTSCTALFAKFGAKPMVAAKLGQGAATALPRYGIFDTGLRLAHFIGQVAHESGGFLYMQEIASGAAYEGRKDLGNVRPGDGRRYKGRGPLQLTGRANYRKFGAILDLDLEDDPDQAADPAVGILIAALYWSLHDLNTFADKDDLRTITKKINGGYNGLDDRETRTLRAKALIL